MWDDHCVTAYRHFKHDIGQCAANLRHLACLRRPFAEIVEQGKAASDSNFTEHAPEISNELLGFVDRPQSLIANVETPLYMIEVRFKHGTFPWNIKAGRFRDNILDKRGVTVARVDEDEDPTIDRFLVFIADDIKTRPQAIRALSPELAARIEGVDVDLDATIDGDVSL